MPTMYVTAPSYALGGPLDRARILAAAEFAATAAGLTVIASPLLDRHIPGWGAWLDPAERVADLRRALDHDVVWAAKGGYGCIHAVPELLGALCERKPSLIGYSDITVLHAVWRRRGWGEGLYGHLGKTPGGRQESSSVALLRGDGYERSALTDPAVRVLRAGTGEGPSFACCLSVLAGLVGSGAVPDLRGHVLFVEDVDERPFQVDHALEQLKLAGHLDGIVGIVGGAFPHQEKADYVGPGIDEILARWAHRLGVPGLSRLPFGHIDDHLVVPSGRHTAISADEGRWQIAFSPRRGI